MTDTTMAGRGFRTGAAEAKEAAKGAAFNRIGYFSAHVKNDGDIAYVRFLTDAWEWITVDMHNMLPTKPQPSDYEGENWPKVVSAVCRNTKMADSLPMFGDCYVEASDMRNPRDQAKPFPCTSRTWAVGVMREAVIGDGSEKLGGPSAKGKRLGFRDMLKEVSEVQDGKPTGKTIKARDIVLFTMGWGNFFSALEGAAQAYGTVLDRDYQITRNGEGLKTDYSIIGLDPTPGFDLRDPTAAAKYGIMIDLNKVDTDGHPLKVYPEEIDISKLVMDRASDEFYAKFIDPTKGTPATTVVNKPSNDVNAQQLAAMAARISGIPVKQSHDASPVDEAYTPSVPSTAQNFDT